MKTLFNFIQKLAVLLTVAAFVTACGHKTPPTVPASVAPVQDQSISVEGVEMPVKSFVLFDFDKAILTPEARLTLDSVAEYIKANPTLKFVIEGHCDERGTQEYNVALGERRAYAALKYLVSKGINSERFITISYGKERPVALGHTEDDYAQNRRAVTVLNLQS